MRCSASNPAQKCAQRKAAQHRGEMYYSAQVQGWLYPATDHRPAGDLPLFTWLFCPFCGELLPTVDAALERLRRPEWTDPSDEDD